MPDALIVQTIGSNSTSAHGALIIDIRLGNQVFSVARFHKLKECIRSSVSQIRRLARSGSGYTISF